MPVNALTWFEIPVTDLARAAAFYERVINQPLNTIRFGEQQLTVFPYQQPGVGGCLLPGNQLTPGNSGTLIYLPVEDSLAAATTRAVQAGAKLLVERVELPNNIGCYAQMIDTEGNRIGIHARH